MRNLGEVVDDLAKKVVELLENEKTGYLEGLKGVYLGEKLDKVVLDPSLIVYFGSISVNEALRTGHTEAFDVELLLLSNLKNTHKNGYLDSLNLAIKARELLLNKRFDLRELRTIRSGDVDPTSITLLNSGKNFNALASVVVTVLVSNKL